MRNLLSVMRSERYGAANVARPDFVVRAQAAKLAAERHCSAARGDG